ncbi:rhomboid family intramembrane serine protease [Ruicaihuangia caeni]|uniref:rhomboid family intramembrane serine protease n=1 Tax=Ruicaihuangia caeni TaxID=3042517 RepID=UPI0030EB95F1
MTWTIMAITALVYLLQAVVPAVTQYLIYYPPFTPWAPWTMLTAIIAHSSFVHLAVNMLTLFLFGPMIEHLLGRWRFLVLYLLAGFGGSVAVLWLAPHTGVLGASGAIFGLLGAFFVIQRGLGGNTAQLVVVIALNLGLGFFVPRISWQAHLGGLIIGALVAFIYMRTRERSKRGVQLALLVSTGALLVAATVARFVMAISFGI